MVGVEGVPSFESPPVEWTRRCLMGDGVELAMLAEVREAVEGKLPKEDAKDEVFA